MRGGDLNAYHDADDANFVVWIIPDFLETGLGNNEVSVWTRSVLVLPGIVCHRGIVWCIQSPVDPNSCHRPAVWKRAPDGMNR